MPKEEGGSTCSCGSMVAIALARPGSMEGLRRGERTGMLHEEVGWSSDPAQTAAGPAAGLSFHQSCPASAWVWLAGGSWCENWFGECFNAFSFRIFESRASTAGRICYISPARFTRANRDYTRSKTRNLPSAQPTSARPEPSACVSSLVSIWGTIVPESGDVSL